MNTVMQIDRIVSANISEKKKESKYLISLYIVTLKEKGIIRFC